MGVNTSGSGWVTTHLSDRMGESTADSVRPPATRHSYGGSQVVTLLTAPLRPLADVLDLTAEAVVALGTVSIGALSLMLASEDHAEYPPLHSVERHRSVS
jgi:hypothetical protein